MRVRGTRKWPSWLAESGGLRVTEFVHHVRVLTNMVAAQDRTAAGWTPARRAGGGTPRSSRLCGRRDQSLIGGNLLSQRDDAFPTGLLAPALAVIPRFISIVY
jgi:hypothetical protein